MVAMALNTDKDANDIESARAGSPAHQLRPSITLAGETT